ncbi:Flp family type IVb pilin [Sphingomonas sp.]|nr:Flp family type IVb pilin [Sphingomonas sp.]HEU4968880.1 Flp family type IVb pilin [Sphingomonas sp.]
MRLQRGATVVEYGLIAALVAIAAMTAMTSLGVNLGGAFHNSSTNRKQI